MARLARKQMADTRALEEENARVVMRGSGHYIGAGATPSTGLSQFRGGGGDGSSDSECDCDVCCGGGRCGGGRCVGGRSMRAPRMRKGGASAPRFSTALTSYRPTSVLPHLVPYVPPRIMPTLTTYRPPVRPTVTTLSTGRAKPSFPREYYTRAPLPVHTALYRAPPVRPTAPRGLPTSRMTPAMRSRIQMALMAGVPLALLGVGLGLGLENADAVKPTYFPDGDPYQPDDGGDGAGGDPYQPGGDMGGPGDGGPGDGGPGDGGGDGRGDLPAGGPGEGVTDYAQPGALPGPSGTPGSGSIPSGLGPDELAWYLQSGNLPDRYYVGSLSQRKAKYGKGRAPDGRSNRAAIVRRVMSEKGMSLPQASKYVKEHGLYKK